MLRQSGHERSADNDDNDDYCYFSFEYDRYCIAYYCDKKKKKKNHNTHAVATIIYYCSKAGHRRVIKLKFNSF